MTQDIHGDVAKAVAAAMAQTGSKIVEIDPIVHQLQTLHTHLPFDKLAELVMFAVAAHGGAVVWPGKG